MYNFKTKLVSITSAAALAISGFNLPALQVTSYAEEASDPVVLEKAKGWTFGIYLCGQDLESYGEAATEDVMEILKAEVPEGFSKDNNIIIETGGCYEWHFKERYSSYLKKEKKMSKKEIAQVIPEEIDSEKLSQYKVNFEFEYEADDGTKKTVPTLEFVKDVAEYDTDSMYEDDDEYYYGMGKKAKNSPDDLEEEDTSDDNFADMGNEKYLREFINDLDTEYPAEHMAIDFWNHGGGITGGVCYDQYTEDPITLAEIKSVLSDRKKAGFDKIDILGYDACLMSNYESWVNISPYVDYGVGSLTSEPGDGWYYTPFFTELGANYDNEEYTAADFASSIVDAYKEFYQNAGKSDEDDEDYDDEDEIVDDDELADEDINEDINEDNDEDNDEDYDDDYDDDDYYASAVLCAVDLNKLALTAPKFAELGNNLFKAYVDAEGIKSIFEASTKNGCVEECYEIVELSKFLDTIKEIAPERIELLEESTKPYDIIAKEAYQNAIDMIDEFKESVNESLVNAYNGYESHQFYDSLAMSIFVPDDCAESDIPLFNANVYPEYSVGDAYARLTYLIGSQMEITDINEIEFNPQYRYDASNGILSLSFTEEERDAIYDSNAFSYVEVDGKTYLVNNYRSYYNSDNPESVLSFKPECGFYSIDGKTPISAVTKDEVLDGIDAQQVSIMGYLNDTYGYFTFLNDTKTGELFFDEFVSYDDEYYYDDDEDYMLAKIKSQKKVLDKVSKKVLAKAKNEDFEDDYYESDEDSYRTELKPGDVIKLEGVETNEVKYIADGMDKEDVNLSEIVSESYTIKESDKKKFTHQIGEDYEITVKRYTPDIKFVKVDGEKCNLAVGYETYNDVYDDFYDDFYYGINSVDDDEDLNDEDLNDEDLDDTEDYSEENDESLDVRIINLGRMKAFADSKLIVENEEFELTGEAITPIVTFEGADTKLVEGTDYTLSYEDNIGIGTAKAILTPLGDLDFLDVRTVEFNIVKKVVESEGKEKIVYVTVVVKEPKQVKIKSVKRNKKAFTVKWKKVKKAAGYEVKYALNKKFTKGKKVKTVKNPKKLSLKVKKLKKKTYFVKVRAFVVDKNGDKVYGSWSKVKKVKVK